MAYVLANPDCTSRMVRHAVSWAAACDLSPLAVKGVLERYKAYDEFERLVWHYRVKPG